MSKNISSFRISLLRRIEHIFSFQEVEHMSTDLGANACVEHFTSYRFELFAQCNIWKML